MKITRWTWILAVVALVALLGAGCAPPSAPPQNDPEPTNGDIIHNLASVDSVDLLILESFPVQVRAVVQGNLPDGCTELGDWTVNRNDTMFEVELPTVRPADAVCTEALVPFEVTIPLEVEGLPAGTYTVDVNGVSESFELAVDNTLSPEDDPGTPPAAGEDASPCEVLSGEGEAVFTNPTGGYCLRYPADFVTSEPEPGVVVIHGPDYSGGPEPLTGFVNIRAGEPANGRTAAAVSEQIIAELDTGEDAMIERVDTLLGGVPAVEIIGTPGLYLSWHVVAVQNDRVVHLVFAPLGEEYAEADADRQALYELVMRSFTFLPAGDVSTP